MVVVYLSARLRFSAGAALVSGALAATSPMLIWYSQENRAYALATFFVACSIYFMLRAPSGGPGALAGWSISACLALASHYFAIFAVVAEAGYLIYTYRHRLRPLLLPLLAPVLVGSALLPLAIYQRDSGHTDYIAAVPLGSRIESTLDQYLLGPYGVSGLRILALSLVVGLGLTVSIARWASPVVRRDAFMLAGVAVATFVLPLLIVPGAFRDKNMIVALPSLLLVVGVALVPRPSLLAVIGGLAVAAIMLFPTVLTAHRLDLQREDWRGMAKLIGPLDRARAVLTYPRFEYIALTHYRPDLEPVIRGKLRLRELVVVGRSQLNTLHLPTGFHRVQDARLGGLRLIRLRARRLRTTT